MNTNWTSMDNAEKLMVVIQSANYEVMGIRWWTAMIAEVTSQIPAEQQAAISGVMTLISNGQTAALTEQLNDMCDMVRNPGLSWRFPGAHSLSTVYKGSEWVFLSITRFKDN